MVNLHAKVVTLIEKNTVYGNFGIVTMHFILTVITKMVFYMYHGP